MKRWCKCVAEGRMDIEEPLSLFMSEPSPTPASSHGLWYGVIAALPFLYLLSAPPVYLTFLKTPATTGTGMFEAPAWVEVYWAPYGWLGDAPLMSDLLRDYFFWWAEMLNVAL